MNKLIFALLTLTVSLSAQSSHLGEYSQDQIDLVNKLFRLCPDEVSEILKRPYTVLSTGSYSGGKVPQGGMFTVYTFRFITMDPLPGGTVSETDLTAEETIRAHETNLTIEVECEVSSDDENPEGESEEKSEESNNY